MNISLNVLETEYAMCACESEFETSERFLLRCNRFFSKILEFFENLEKVAKDKVVFY